MIEAGAYIFTQRKATFNFKWCVVQGCCPSGHPITFCRWTREWTCVLLDTTNEKRKNIHDFSSAQMRFHWLPWRRSKQSPFGILFFKLTMILSAVTGSWAQKVEVSSQNTNSNYQSVNGIDGSEQLNRYIRQSLGEAGNLLNQLTHLQQLQAVHQTKDLESSASNNQYGGSYGAGGNSLIGNFLGEITGSLLRQILHSLTGIGIKLGVNLKNEFYKVPEYGYGGGQGGNNYQNMQYSNGNY